MSAAHDGGTGAEWSDDESRPSHTKIVEGGQGVVQGGALDSGVVEIIGGQADDGAGGRGGEVESAGGARGTVLASGGLITGAEGEDAGEAVLESHPERERDKGACSRGGAVSGVVSSGTGVPLQTDTDRTGFILVARDDPRLGRARRSLGPPRRAHGLWDHPPPRS